MFSRERRARGVHKKVAAELLQALDQQWAEATPDCNDIRVLSFKSRIGGYIVVLARTLNLLIRRADYKDPSTLLQETVTRLAYALLTPNDATEVPFADDNFVRAAYRLLIAAARPPRHPGSGGNDRMHVYTAAALVTATLVLYKNHNTDLDSAPHKLVDTFLAEVTSLHAETRRDHKVDVGSATWHHQMCVACKLWGVVGGIATNHTLLHATLSMVAFVLRHLATWQLPGDQPTNGAGANKVAASTRAAADRAATKRVRDVAGELVVALDTTMRQLGTLFAGRDDPVMKPLYDAFDASTKKRLLAPEMQKVLDVYLQPFSDAAAAEAAAQAAAAALLRDEQPAASAAGKEKKKKAKQKKAKQWDHVEINVEEMECPITQTLMVDPVIAADGHTYERTALEEWFSRNETSPMTGMVLDMKHLFPNIALRRLIQSYMAAQQAGHAQP
ncbi:hypothetical protein WJX72_004016 [[Myrmecia] bisecta]|uniref:U-box domain-containing protein n=1 Tax=[Myrmecia] bisecta TaxID=41462 RepID=A0AAW1R639_9CHLO